MESTNKTISDDPNTEYAHRLFTQLRECGHTLNEIKQIGARIVLEAKQAKENDEPISYPDPTPSSPLNDLEWPGASNENDEPLSYFDPTLSSLLNDSEWPGASNENDEPLNPTPSSLLNDSEWPGAPNENDEYLHYPDPSLYTLNNSEWPRASFGDPSFGTNSNMKSSRAGGSGMTGPVKKTENSRDHANVKAGVKKSKGNPVIGGVNKGTRRRFSTIPGNIAADTSEFLQQCPSMLNPEDREAWSRCRDILVDPASYVTQPTNDPRQATREAKSIMDKLAWSRQVLRTLQEVADGHRDRAGFLIQGRRVVWVKTELEG